MKYIVDVGDLKYAYSSEDSFITYSLGSCIGLTVYEPILKIGGMLHLMLADSKLSPEKAAARPGMFADSGIELLFNKIVEKGGNQKKFQIKIAGGANVLENCKIFNIAKNNIAAVRKILWQKAIMIKAADVGGTRPRTMFFSLADGCVKIKSDGVVKEL